MPWQTASQLTNSIAFSETKTHVKAYWHTRNDRVDLKLYLACSVKDFGGELLIQNGIQRRIFVVTNVQIENIIVENVNMKCIKWIKHKMFLNTYPLAEAENKRFLLFFTNHIFNVLPLIFVKEEMLKLFRPVDREELSFENAKNVAIHWTNIVQNWYISLRML
ncbi:hypothetical protein T08_12501 [Trichinella sp. T8]|nr:hypothetical protein T08_12501 [Trichinella sp. T8]